MRWVANLTRRCQSSAFPRWAWLSAFSAKIMSGGLSMLREAGGALLGGHSVRDDEIKFGYAVTGVIETKNIKQNNGAKPGNRVFLGKPLGTGLITTALKRGKAAPDHVQA